MGPGSDIYLNFSMIDSLVLSGAPKSFLDWLEPRMLSAISYQDEAYGRQLEKEIIENVAIPKGDEVLRRLSCDVFLFLRSRRSSFPKEKFDIIDRYHDLVGRSGQLIDFYKSVYYLHKQYVVTWRQSGCVIHKVFWIDAAEFLEGLSCYLHYLRWPGHPSQEVTIWGTPSQSLAKKECEKALERLQQFHTDSLDLLEAIEPMMPSEVEDFLTSFESKLLNSREG